MQQITATTASIAWGTELGVDDTVLRFGRDDRAEQIDPESSTLRIGETAEIALHHVDLTGLLPGTRYCYGVEVAGESRRWNLHFQTAPASPDAAVTFLAIGDMGAGTPDRYAVREAMMAYLDEADFLVTLGDNAYSSGDCDELHFDVFRDHQELLSRVPAFGTLGNHDYKTEDAQP